MQQDPQGTEFRKLRQYADFKNKEVLEVGCGNGRVSAMLAPIIASLVAIDPDGERLKAARAKVPGVDFRQGVGENLEFPDCTFDIVAFTFSLHHQDPVKALAEARRVLRPSGSVVIIEPAVAGDMHPLFRIFRDEDEQIAAAQAAIRGCGLRPDMSEAFDIEYIFEDLEDIYDYYFGNYGIPREPERMGRMKEELAGKTSAKPIRLVETVNIASLTKI